MRRRKNYYSNVGSRWQCGKALAFDFLAGHEVGRYRQILLHVAGRDIPIAVIHKWQIGDGSCVADHVGSERYHVARSDVGLLCELNGIIHFDAEITNGAFDL